MLQVYVRRPHLVDLSDAPLITVYILLEQHQMAFYLHYYLLKGLQIYFL